MNAKYMESWIALINFELYFLLLKPFDEAERLEAFQKWLINHFATSFEFYPLEFEYLIAKDYPEFTEAAQTILKYQVFN